tara:strand:+ start:94 stop:348 length:255 start_codon:yes stop_codon:yes gene_type:complete
MGNKMPSKFVVRALATDDEIWNKILDILSPEDRKEADKSASVIKEPYLGGKEITVRRSNKTNIAFASLSEIHKGEDEWAVYREE